MPLSFLPDVFCMLVSFGTHWMRVSCFSTCVRMSMAFNVFYSTFHIPSLRASFMEEEASRRNSEHKQAMSTVMLCFRYFHIAIAFWMRLPIHSQTNHQQQVTLLFLFVVYSSFLFFHPKLKGKNKSSTRAPKVLKSVRRHTFYVLCALESRLCFAFWHKFFSLKIIALWWSILS